MPIVPVVGIGGAETVFVLSAGDKIAEVTGLKKGTYYLKIYNENSIYATENVATIWTSSEKLTLVKRPSSH